VKVQVLIGEEVYEVEVDGSKINHGSSPLKDIALPLGPKIQSAVVRAAPADDGGDGKVCRSPLAGIVARVHVHAGQQLQTGDLILVLEAMKMETNIRAPRAVTPKAVKVAPGDVVKPDQVLVEFE